MPAKSTDLRCRKVPIRYLLRLNHSLLNKLLQATFKRLFDLSIGSTGDIERLPVVMEQLKSVEIGDIFGCDVSTEKEELDAILPQFLH